MINSRIKHLIKLSGIIEQVHLWYDGPLYGLCHIRGAGFCWFEWEPVESVYFAYELSKKEICDEQHFNLLFNGDLWTSRHRIKELEKEYEIYEKIRPIYNKNNKLLGYFK